MEILVQALARILFQMRAGEANLDLASRGGEDHDLSALNDGNLVLADLIALRQVGIEVVLAREHAPLVDRSAHGQAEADGALDRAFVQHRQHARQGDVDRRGLAVRRRTEGGRGCRKDLRCGRKLRVGFQPDDGFPFHSNDSRMEARRPGKKRRILAVSRLSLFNRTLPARAGASRSPAGIDGRRRGCAPRENDSPESACRREGLFRRIRRESKFPERRSGCRRW